MNVDTGQTSVAAGASINLLAGKLLEFCPYNAFVSLLTTGDAAFAMRLTMQAGVRTIFEESQISGAARVPIAPDDLLVSNTPIRRGERIILKARNTGAGANTIFWILRFRRA